MVGISTHIVGVHIRAEKVRVIGYRHWHVHLHFIQRDKCLIIQVLIFI